MKVFEGELPIIFPSGSCAAMVRVFYEELFHGDEQALEAVRSISPRVFELSEYLVDVVGVSKIPFCNSEDRKPSSVTYHEACHLRRELGALIQARTLIDNVPDTELVEMYQSEVCCGFGGTFSVKYPDISGAMLDDKIENIVESFGQF
jgi:L-lactate dehydrogenase complex protein LldE